VPALVALLGAALDREALQAEVVETRALRRSDEIKTAVLRAVSHDLRSPLTSIITAGEALRSRGVDSAERAELADSVVEEAARLSTLVDKLLEMSQLQAGAAAPRTDWCSIDEVIRGAAERAAGAADFTLSLDGDLPLIKADAAQLERALENLLENAARYANGHAVSVRARTVGTWLVIRVVDRGPGIPTSELEHVFEAFYRGRDVGSRHAGAGLGLAIVRGFIEANGGRVWAESTPGQGTTFVVQLPLADSAAASATTQPATRQSA